MLLSRHSVALIAGLWFAVAFATVLYQWGLNPRVFPAGDEAIVRFAAQLIREHGNPFLKLPFPDPEDLAHARLWLSRGDIALPAYAPVTLYGYSVLLRLHALGLLLVAFLPAAAVAAFAAGTARLLPNGRRWLALLAPLLGYASLYWVLRPWMNLSSVLVGLCWAFFFWTVWREDARLRWLLATTLSVGMAAAVRPDYAGFLLLAATLLILAHHPSQWRLVVLCIFGAGLGAVVPNLIMNRATTGHAFLAAYQIVLDRQYGADASHGLDGSHGLSPFSVLKVLLAPMGLPSVKVGTTEFHKYFVTMRPALALLLAQLALIPILRERSRLSRALYLALLLLVVFFAVTHLHNDVYGGAEHFGHVHHSVARYLAPIFLFAALPPILFLGQCRLKVPLVLGAALACAVGAGCAYQLYVGEPASFGFVHRWVGSNNALLGELAPQIPSDAMVYSAKLDKVLWSKWRVGMLDEPEPSAVSMGRALDAGLPVFALEPSPRRQFRRVVAALKARGIALVRVDAHNGLYRLDRRVGPTPTTE